MKTEFSIADGILAVRKGILPPTRALQLLDQAIANRLRLSDRLYQQARNTFLNGWS